MARHKGVTMLRRSKMAFLTLTVLGLMLGATSPAEANSYPGLVEKEWSHGTAVLNARLAIEVNSYGEGRFRWHLHCYYDYGSGRVDQLCDFDPGYVTWCDLTANICYSRDLALLYDSDHTWVGSYRTLINNHTYAVKVISFQAYFATSEYLGAYHSMCSKKVTWHTGGSPTIGGYPWDWC
jgi:hypothetical protein